MDNPFEALGGYIKRGVGYAVESTVYDGARRGIEGAIGGAISRIPGLGRREENRSSGNDRRGLDPRVISDIQRGLVLLGLLNEGSFVSGVYDKDTKEAYKRFESNPENKKGIQNYVDELRGESTRADGIPDGPSLNYFFDLVQARAGNAQQQGQQNAHGASNNVATPASAANVAPGNDVVLVDGSKPLPVGLYDTVNKTVLAPLAAMGYSVGAQNTYDAKTQKGVQDFQNWVNAKLPEGDPLRLPATGQLTQRTASMLWFAYCASEEERKRRQGISSSMTLEQMVPAMVKSITESNMPPDIKANALALLGQMAQLFGSIAPQTTQQVGTQQANGPQVTQSSNITTQVPPGQGNAPSRMDAAYVAQLQAEVKALEITVAAQNKQIAELRADGRLPQQVQSAASILPNSIPVTAPSASVSTTNDHATFSRDDSNEVKELQDALKKTLKRDKNGNGRDVGALGDWKSASEAVRRFQEENNLPVTGDANRDTLLTLVSKLTSDKAAQAKDLGGFDANNDKTLTGSELEQYTASLLGDPNRLVALSGLKLITVDEKTGATLLPTPMASSATATRTPN